jgi:hypothetical protein
MCCGLRFRPASAAALKPAPRDLLEPFEGPDSGMRWAACCLVIRAARIYYCTPWSGGAYG